MKICFIVFTLVYLINTCLAAQENNSQTDKPVYALELGALRPFYTTSKDNIDLKGVGGKYGLSISFNRTIKLNKSIRLSTNLQLDYIKNGQYHYTYNEFDQKGKIIISTETGSRNDRHLALRLPIEIDFKLIGNIHYQLGFALSKELFERSITSRLITDYYYYDIPLRKFFPYLYPKTQNYPEFKNTNVTKSPYLGVTTGLSFKLKRPGDMIDAINLTLFYSSQKISLLNFTEIYVAASFTRSL